MEQEEKEEIIRFFFNIIGVFNHFSFFTKKLWRKVKGFRKEDEAEIKSVFMHYWFHHKFGNYTCPCGIGWYAEVSKSIYESYLQKYQPIIDAYENWKIKQS